MSEKNFVSYSDAETLLTEIGSNLDAKQAELNRVFNDYGAKNLLKVDAHTRTVGNLTFTVYSDGRINVSGTQPTEDYEFSIGSYRYDSERHGVFTNYWLSGGINENVFLRVWISGSAMYYDDDTGSGIKFVLSRTNSNASFKIVIKGAGEDTPLTINETLYPMFRYNDVSNAAWRPYAMTNEELTSAIGNKADKTALADYATVGELKDTVGWTGKNKLKGDGATATSNGITFTLNPDGSVTANGTASGNATFMYKNSFSYSNEFAGNILSGCPAGGGSETYFIMFQQAGSPYFAIAQDNGDGQTVKSVSGTISAYVFIRIMSGQTVNNLVFRPMIRETNTDSAYEPYHDSVETCLGGKASKVASATNGNLAGLDANGNLTDSGFSASSFLSSAYLEQTVTLSTSADTTVTFTSSLITTSSLVDIAVSEWGLVPNDVTVSNGSCAVVFPSVDSAHTVTVRLYVR